MTETYSFKRELFYGPTKSVYNKGEHRAFWKYILDHITLLSEETELNIDKSTMSDNEVVLQLNEEPGPAHKVTFTLDDNKNTISIQYDRAKKNEWNKKVLIKEIARTQYAVPDGITKPFAEHIKDWLEVKAVQSKVGSKPRSRSSSRSHSRSGGSRKFHSRKSTRKTR